MRLLNARSKKLEEFEGADIPSYAILSHTWEKEEVLFHHVEDEGSSGAKHYTDFMGWFKIEKSCEQALRDGLEYVWVDTTCIDKSSSAELSEAINSMFKWYRDAVVCYSYLYDVPGIALKDSRWFTRGWTLQEMIAPYHLKFYDRDWKYLGTKAEMTADLHHITGVDAAVLVGRNLRFTSVARKMSWAAKRYTRRVEDMAYCLLGLFDISMPMLYGEGAKAFIRLQEEIVKEYDDHSLFAWKSSDTADYSVGLFAKSPAAFADSADIVPCIGRRHEPVIVTSRGLRITMALMKVEDNDTTYLAALNCRVLDFDMEHKKRVAIALTKCGNFYSRSDVTNVYIRNKPGELSTAISMVSERVSLYILKESQLDVVASQVLWLRSMPKWPQHQPYSLVSVHPPDRWDKLNSLFRMDNPNDAGLSQVALVFR
jgi:hypothetical protein